MLRSLPLIFFIVLLHAPVKGSENKAIEGCEKNSVTSGMKNPSLINSRGENALSSDEPIFMHHENPEDTIQAKAPRKKRHASPLALGIIGTISGATAFFFPAVPVLALVAVILGVVALDKIKKDKNRKGKALAWMAIILGIAAVLFALALIIAGM